jgi:hypothetical protein
VSGEHPTVSGEWMSGEWMSWGRDVAGLSDAAASLLLVVPFLST